MTHTPWKIIALTFLVGLAVSLPATGFADEGALMGEYKLKGSKEQAQKKIHTAIDELVEDVNAIKRGFAKRRLRATNEAIGEIEIKISDEKIAVQYDDDPPGISPKGNKPANWKNSEGESYRLRQQISGRTLTQKFESDEGARTNKLTVSEDGNTIDLQVTVTSDQLPRPLTYSLTYSAK